MEITVNIKCPDLPLAAAALAKALMGHSPTSAPQAPESNAAEVKEAMQTAPFPAAPVPVATLAVPAAQAPAVPVTTAPQITGEMVAKAGADLLRDNPNVYSALMALLQKYGVGCAQELRPDQIGPFATEMRALGARI